MSDCVKIWHCVYLIVSTSEGVYIWFCICLIVCVSDCVYIYCVCLIVCVCDYVYIWLCVYLIMCISDCVCNWLCVCVWLCVWLVACAWMSALLRRVTKRQYLSNLIRLRISYSGQDNQMLLLKHKFPANSQWSFPQICMQNKDDWPSKEICWSIKHNLSVWEKYNQ